MYGNMGGDSHMVDRTDLVQRYEVSVNGSGYSLCEYKNDGSVINKSTHEVVVLPLNSTHRQAFYELGVAGMVSGLTGPRSGAGYIIVDGGAISKKWMMEGTQHYPGLIRCAVDQLFVDLESLKHDRSHERIVKLGIASIHSDTIHDCLQTGKPQKRGTKRPVLAECRKTKSVIIEGIGLHPITSAPQALHLIESTLANAPDSHTVVSLCVEDTPQTLHSKSGTPAPTKVHWLHFVSLSVDQPPNKPRGGGGGMHPTSFRTAITTCLNAVRSNAASVPYHRHKLTFFLRPALSASHASCYLTCLTPFSPFSNVQRAGDSLREAVIYSTTAEELATTVDERIHSAPSPPPTVHSTAIPLVQTSLPVYEEREPSVHHTSLVQKPKSYGYAQSHVFSHDNGNTTLHTHGQGHLSRDTHERPPHRQNTTCLQGWDGSSTLTDLTNPPTPAVPLDFGQSPTRAGPASPRQPPTHHIVRRHGSVSPVRVRSPPSREPKPSPKPLASHVNTPQPYSFSSFKKAVSEKAALLEETPQTDKKKEAKPLDEAKYKQALADVQAIKQEFDMYRNVMDATLLRLKNDVVRANKEKEELRKLAAKKERTWRKEQSEVVTLSKDLRLATKRIEELEAQRSQLQGEFHEELVKLDKRQQTIVEEKLKLERASHETVIRVGQLEEENSKLVEALEKGGGGADANMLREENSHFARELQAARLRIHSLETQLQAYAHDAPLELPSAIGGWKEEPSVHIHEVTSEYIPSEAPTVGKGSMRRPPPPKSPPSGAQAKGKRTQPPKPPPPRSASGSRSGSIIEAAELNDALQKLVQQPSHYADMRQSPAGSPDPRPERQV
eukprot:TRINITY_DN14002_c0_g1_i2.p1 TRINITY_DN14002_c0_g1~~TRINITY_DN14002_c0_g1_i2.p1  ORF type:complete len:852 (+),score=213.37 TRINITY_DN14002_c0_g1_i2:45-2558(+)